GLDAAGEVVAVGESVPHVRRGDRVFGSRNGAFAELVAGRTFVTMPANLSFEEAAALPTVGYTALQALRDKGALRAGQRVLVIGAGGGVGSVAVQIAKSLGGTVTGVTSRAKADMVRSLGADDVLEHGELRLRRRVRPFDLIIDIASDRSLRELSELLTTTGTLVMVGPGRGNWAGPLMRIGAAVVRSRIGTRRIEPFLAKPNRDDLVVLRDLAESGALRPVIDSTYPLSDVADAIRRVESGQACGKVVITV
ncbi:MAG TPA: NAD(P)-dependent alcohol dehydrogenase, partial [Candidatus Limnocylindrales bacterium]|nr:NAD(P)-dependent alcohol dehydrogenase [Candidatus Limnocylindrales bacterium]